MQSFHFPAKIRTESDCAYLYSENRRRNLILSTLFSGMIPLDSHAAEPTSTAESIRRSAAKIPGIGQTDVFYPVSFLGKWKVTQNIVASDQFSLQSRLPLTLQYEVRFLPCVDDNAVVADRGYNQAAFDKALHDALYSREDATLMVRSFEWTATNPNDLRLVFSNGSREEIKVTKRATEMTEETVSSSEFQRITREDGQGIPSISAQRVLQKYKVVSDTQVEGIEIVYDAGSGLGDPMKMSIGGNTAAPQVLSKSRLNLTRLQ